MWRATGVERAGQWPSERRAAAATLPYDSRHRRRFRLETDSGEPFLLDLPEPTVLAHGDGLALDDGTWIEVLAADEALLEVTADDPVLLLKLAWHLGNRHLPAQIDASRILIRPDHVIAGMVRGLGGQVRNVTTPFRPEGGAYEPAPHREHAHGGQR